MGMFALKLKELREAAGLTQEQLADRAGMHGGGVRKLEQGEREPSWATVQALAGALGVDCRAFAEPPAREDREPTPRGRPAKALDEKPGGEKRVKKKSGRKM